MAVDFQNKTGSHLAETDNCRYSDWMICLSHSMCTTQVSSLPVEPFGTSSRLPIGGDSQWWVESNYRVETCCNS